MKGIVDYINSYINPIIGYKLIEVSYGYYTSDNDIFYFDSPYSPVVDKVNDALRGCNHHLGLK